MRQGNSLPQEAFILSFNALIDASNALILRNTIELTDIGYYLGHAAAVLSRYDDDIAALESIKHKIAYIEAESTRQGMEINFYTLEHHRSTSSDYGLSFVEEHHLLYTNLERYLAATRSFRQFAAGYLDDPPSLRDHRLLRNLG